MRHNLWFGFMKINENVNGVQNIACIVVKNACRFRIRVQLNKLICFKYKTGDDKCDVWEHLLPAEGSIEMYRGPG